MAVNLAGNYKPPHLARVNQVTETSCNVQWLKGIYKRKWVCGWSLTPKFQRKVSFTLIFSSMKIIN